MRVSILIVSLSVLLAIATLSQASGADNVIQQIKLTLGRIEEVRDSNQRLVNDLKGLKDAIEQEASPEKILKMIKGYAESNPAAWREMEARIRNDLTNRFGSAKSGQSLL